MDFVGGCKITLVAIRDLQQPPVSTLSVHNRGCHPAAHGRVFTRFQSNVFPSRVLLQFGPLIVQRFDVVLGHPAKLIGAQADLRLKRAEGFGPVCGDN